jgi:glycosyltransferase involved in cell wall biosynthesis
MQSAVVATMSAVHRAIRTWDQMVNVYIALSEFSRRKFIQGGLPAEKIVIKPNFIPDSVALNEMYTSDYALYLGRLSAEKGIQTLLSAWETIDSISLKIAGDGPLREQVLSFAQRQSRVRYLGFQDRAAVQMLIRSARFVVVPSICYENFPMAIIEAFANRVPVIAARLGAIEELVQEGKTGLLFKVGDSVDLAAKVTWLWAHPDEVIRMGINARAEYQEKYTPARNIDSLIDIYSRAIRAGPA